MYESIICSTKKKRLDNHEKNKTCNFGVNNIPRFYIDYEL